MVGYSMDKDSMDNDSMVGRLERMDKWVKMGIDKLDVFFFDVSHSCHNRTHSHYHRICHIDRNQIVS